MKILQFIFDLVMITATVFFIAFIVFIINGCTPVLHDNPVELMNVQPKSIQDQMSEFSKKWNADNKARYEACKKKKGLPILDYETGKWECLTDLEQIRIKKN